MAERPSNQLIRLTRDWLMSFVAAYQLMRRQGPSQVQFWLIAASIGTGAGFAALGFRKAIERLQAFLYGTEDTAHLHSYAETLPWYWVLLLPVLGGLVTGLVLHWFTPDGRVRSVADVIEGTAMQQGRVEYKAGLASAFASLVTLSSGGSTGREGPVVHMAAMIASRVSDEIRADGITGRDLLGCAVAAAVSASFNAPIAGALFALEVVLRHFAVHAFAPIVIASVAGTIINRIEYGGVTEFLLPEANVLEFYIELPAFILLGLTCGLVATVLMRSIFYAEDLGNYIQNATGMPRWLRPALAGGLLGGIAIYFPHVIGVGYETTSATLTGQILLWQAVVFAVVKVVAVAITIAGRMGGGVFSPSMMIGALTGLAFGLIATSIFPEVSGAHTLYALAGMGAVAAAVLGAPISTTMIVFEMTGDWQTGLAVMVAVSLSTALASRLVDRSFFLTQLERRGRCLSAGPQAYLLAMFTAGSLMRRPEDPGAADPARCAEMIEDGIWLEAEATLQEAMPLFDRAGVPFLPVAGEADGAGNRACNGALFHVDALKTYNRALAATAAEEHS